jgi:phosphohistidine swiveling domain-containing protein
MVSHFDDAFKVTWVDPQDAESIWAIDRIHFTHPLTPLTEAFYSEVVADSWATPVVFVNGYAYFKDFAPPPTPDEVIERGAAVIWREKYLPLVQEICARIRDRDYDSMSAAELVEMLPVVFKESAEAFSYPTVVASAFMRPGMVLADFCDREIGPDGPVMVTTLLQGFANDSIAAGVGLGELAEFAATKPEVSVALRDRHFGSIASLPGGEEFMAKFSSYLDAFGWRAEEWCLVHLPTWIEEPNTPLYLIGRYLHDPEHSPAEAMRRSVEQRQATAADIESRLPENKRAEFTEMVAAAQPYVQVSEERALWQLIAIGSIRVPVLALGRKLVEAGAVKQPDDVFYLTLSELQELAEKPKPSFDLVSARRAEHIRREGLNPPQSIGKPLVVSERPRVSQIVHRFFFGVEPEQEVDGDVIKGIGASQGVMTGRARVIRSLSESDALEAGEILVCRNTAPPWTPLFAIAGAVVTDVGGLLSHSAICAREYAIPCVVGTGVATSRISDGSTITVDGTNGTITLQATSDI